MDYDIADKHDAPSGDHRDVDLIELPAETPSIAPLEVRILDIGRRTQETAPIAPDLRGHTRLHVLRSTYSTIKDLEHPLTRQGLTVAAYALDDVVPHRRGNGQ